ncbi:MAG: hypothetical protein U5J82_03970 [Desulfobacterales bacterium]|nr:hypothetical protein [Desulfobacterales bacterium]
MKSEQVKRLTVYERHLRLLTLGKKSENHDAYSGQSVWDYDCCRPIDAGATGNLWTTGGDPLPGHRQDRPKWLQLGYVSGERED